MEDKNMFVFGPSGKGTSKFSAFTEFLALNILKQLREKYPNDYKNIIYHESITDWIEKRGVVIESSEKQFQPVINNL
jgi:hypothetical protein